VDHGLRITALDPDEDYLGIEVVASNERFAGAAWIYAGVEELSHIAQKMEGFPCSFDDRRTYELGNRDRAFGGGSLVLPSAVLIAPGIWRLISSLRTMRVDTLGRRLRSVFRPNPPRLIIS